MTFKLMPFVTFIREDKDDNRPEAHYKFKMKNIAIGNITKLDKDVNDPENYDTYETSDINQDVLAESILGKNKTLDGVKTIYFDDSCKVPRFKLGELCGKTGIKVIRDRDKADAVIYGNKFVTELFKTENVSSFNYKADFIKQAKKIKNNYNLNSEIIPLIETCSSDIIFTDSWHNEGTDKLHVQKKCKTDADPSFSLYYTEIRDESKYLLTKKNNLIHQDIILENLSNIVIDEDMFISINNMFASVDHSNHSLAMEIMSNTAYKKSIVYLLELVRRYRSEIDNVSEKNNISFKALTEYLQFNSSSIDTLIDVVIKKNTLTEFNYNRILKFILEEENKNLENNTSNWRILSVDLSPEQKAKIIWDKKEEPILTETL